jgi:Spy/CpxP family protein refolding chaperone
MNSSRVLRRLNAVVALMTTSNSPFSTAAVFLATDAWRRVSKEFYKMKKLLICTLLTVALACCGTTLFAQMESGSSQEGGGMRHMPMSTDDRLQHLSQMLNLTSDQQQKIRPILDQESQQMQSLRGDTSMSREDKMTKMRSIRENTMSQITPILTADQQKKLQETQMHHMARHPQAGGEPATPPSPPQQ